MEFDANNILVLAILGSSVVLFVIDKLRADLVAMLVMLTLVVSGLLAVEQAFSGFASPAVVTVWAVFIISGALYRTGVADKLAMMMLRLAGQSHQRLLVVIMLTVGLLSAFMNNIGAVAILMPAVTSICRARKIPPSKLLMPLAFAALLGGNMTLIGTPPNILAAAILQKYSEVEPLKFFDFLPTGLMVLTAGIIYMGIFGDYLLPERSPGVSDVSKSYPVRDYLMEMRLAEESRLVGRTVAETRFGEEHDLNILQVRHENFVIGPRTNYKLQAGDVLLIEGPYRDILAAGRANALQSVKDWIGDEWHPDHGAEDLQLAEIALTAHSRREGQTIKEMAFRSRYGLSVLAIRHHGRALTSHLGDVPLSFGDSLLIQGTQEKIDLLRENPNFLLLDIAPQETKRTSKAPLALLILAVALIIITFNWLDVATTLVAAAMLLVILNVITMEEAYRSIDWQSIFLIAGMLPLGMAMEETGTARLLASGIVELVGGIGPLAVLAGIFVLTTLLTSVISNAAATVLMVPICIDAALSVGADPRPFVMSTIIAASTAFLMPVGHQVNIIIFGPGGYKFSDYARVGVWLAIILLAICVILLPMVWPLFP